MMYSDRYVFYYGEYEYRYVNKDGVVVTKSGCYKLGDGRDIYIDNDGCVVIGIVKWNGKGYISGY